MLTNIFAVFLGGGIGAVIRYITTLICQNLFSLSIIGTLFVNLVGCFLIGYMFGGVQSKSTMISPTLRIFVMVGFLGGLTTFSTFSIEVFDIIKKGKVLIGGSYMIGSCLLGLILSFGGYYLGLKH